MIGVAIDGAINKTRRAVRSVVDRRPLRSQTTESAFGDSAADELAKLAGLLDRGLITRDQFDLQRDRLLDVS
jgi:Short C-terminal domain